MRTAARLDEGFDDFLLKDLEFAVGAVDFVDFFLEFLHQFVAFKAIAKDKQDFIIVPRFFEILEESDVIDGFDGVFFVSVDMKFPLRLVAYLA